MLATLEADAARMVSQVDRAKEMARSTVTLYRARNQMAKQSMAADSASEASQAAPVAPVASDAPAGVPAAPAATVDDVAALKEQLAQQTAKMAEQEAAHRREMQALRSTVPSPDDVNKFVQEAVAAAIAGRPIPTSSEQQTLEKQMAKVAVESKAREEARANDLKKLAEGPQLFSVCKQDEPRMERTVGAIDKDHAKAKYETFMGIRHSEVPYSITQLDKAPLAAPGVNAA